MLTRNQKIQKMIQRKRSIKKKTNRFSKEPFSSSERSYSKLREKAEVPETFDELFQSISSRKDIRELAEAITTSGGSSSNEMDEECALLIESCLLYLKTHCTKPVQTADNAFQLLSAIDILELEENPTCKSDYELIMDMVSGEPCYYLFHLAKEMSVSGFAYVCARAKYKLLPFTGDDPCHIKEREQQEKESRDKGPESFGEGCDDDWDSFDGSMCRDGVTGNAFEGKANPILVKQFLDETVIGQDKAKISLSVALASHMEAYRNKTASPRSTTLLIGPSGSGKTMLAKRLSEYADLPVLIIDSSQITADGWKGLDKGEAIAEMFKKYPKEKAEYGIVVLDEFDKLCKNAGADQLGKYARKDQESMLGLLDGVPVRVNGGDRTGMSQNAVFETKNMMFILTGAFSQMEDTEKIENRKGAIGFGVVKERPKDTDIRTRLIRFGLIPELVGRITDIEFTTPLSEDEIVSALLSSEGSYIREYEELLSNHGKRLVVDEKKLRAIVLESFKNGLGVRGARNRLEEELRPKIFEAFEKNMEEVVIS